MLRRTLVALAFASTLASAAAPVALVAQTPSLPPQLNGSFRYAHDDAHARAIVAAALAPRIARLPEGVRSMAQERIQQRIRVAERVTIRAQGSRVRVQYEGPRALTVETPLGESAVVQDQDGRELRVTQRLTGGRLEQLFRGAGVGTMRQVLSTSADGATLHVDTTISGGNLGEPVGWRHDYTRAR